jgi:hypothetical protein
MLCADVTLRDLNNSLLREEEGLMGQRGMVNGYVGDPTLNESQTFMVWIPQDIRRKYESTLLAMVEQVRTLRF